VNNAKSQTVAFIFARGGSKGIPRKNIRLLAGKPLIAYAIETGLAAPSVDRVIVSTEDEEIADISRRYGAEVPFLRPVELAGDTASEWHAWQHALRAVQEADGTDAVGIFVCLPPTSPLRSIEDVEHCVRELELGEADMVYTVTEAGCNPYYNMVELDAGGYARVVMAQGARPYRRQDAPIVYNSTTVAYAVKPSYVFEAKSFFAGKVKAVKVPPERAVEIDSELDFRFAEFLMSNGRGQQ
jgi:N,N'-diacetyl-8-epilegionaminate cytidylyltransferase